MMTNVYTVYIWKIIVPVNAYMKRCRYTGREGVRKGYGGYCDVLKTMTDVVHLTIYYTSTYK